MAFPKALYWAASLPTSSKSSGKDCILATSLGVNLRYLLSSISTGSVLFKDTFAKCAPTVLQGLLISCALPLFILSLFFIIPATARSLKKYFSSTFFSMTFFNGAKLFSSSISTSGNEKFTFKSFLNPTIITRSLFCGTP